jgi:hypothetical protein
VEPIYPPGFTQELQFILQGGAQLEDNARAQRGSSLGYLFKAAQGLRAHVGMGRLQLHFLLIADVGCLSWFLFGFLKITQRVLEIHNRLHKVL